jgi:hypothetical protein
MKRLILKFFVVTLLFSSGAVFTNCAKEGCPASMALQNETMGTGESKKKSKPPKNTSGVLIPEGKQGKKY